MTHEDSGWRPTAGMEGYGGHELWAYTVGPHQINEGEVDGDIDLAELLDAGEPE